MGLKFIGSEVAGKKPVSADIGERELAVNLVDGSMYSKNTSGVIVQIGGGAAGKEYSATATYGSGDMTQEAGVLYYSLTDANKGNMPSTSPTQWHDFATSSHPSVANATFTPVTGTQYPDVTGESVGAVSVIDGLGVDVNGDKVSFPFTGGPLDTLSVIDGDTISWVSGPVSAPIWLKKAAPVLIAERGGLAFATGTSYNAGDIVTDGGIAYIAAAPVKGSLPSAGVTGEWKTVSTPEVGGALFDPLVQYKIGDIVSYAAVIYVVPEDSVTAGKAPALGTLPTSATWSNAVSLTSKIDTSNWVSEISGVADTDTTSGTGSVGPSNPAKAGTSTELLSAMTKLDAFIADPGTY